MGADEPLQDIPEGVNFFRLFPKNIFDFGAERQHGPNK
jgi:hypothetical protein